MKQQFLLVLMLASVGSFAQVRAVFGTVTDSAGAPLEGVSVSLMTEQHPADGKQTTTDKKGRYAFRDFKPGDIVITLELEGFLKRELRYRTSQESGRDRQDAVMYREGEGAATDSNSVAVTGKVHNTQGQPLAGVVVVCSVEGTPFSNETVTAEDGSFTVRALMNNLNLLRGSLKEYRDQIVQVKVSGNEIDLSGPSEFVLKTIDEAYAELGMERPKEEEVTPEQEAVEIFNLAVEPYQQGDFAQAEELAKKALEKDPNQEAATKLLVFANLKQEDWEEVLTYSEKYLKFKPDDTNIMQAAAQAAQLTNKADKVDAYKAKLKDKGVINKDSLWNDAVDALNANDDAKASEVIGEILKMDPKDSRAYFELGRIKAREYEFDEAVKLLKQYMSMAGKSDKYYNDAKELILALSE